MMKKILTWMVVITFLASTIFTATPSLVHAGDAVTVQVDAAQDIHPINPLIYGLAFANESTLKDLNIPVNRSGGNAQTRYNWKADATNRAMDWYFESLPNDNANPSILPHGSSTDQFYEINKASGSQTMLTIPMIGYVAKDRERRASFSVAKYGPQQDTDAQWFPDAGNGVRTDGTKITNNDPLDAHIKVDENFMSDWVKHLTGKYGNARSGGVKYYLLDNEPGLWHETHRDVCKTAPHDDELISTSIKYANTIKNADPGALTVGPEEWGWLSLKISPYDFQVAANTNNWSNFADKDAHGYNFFAEYYLKKMKEAEQTYGKRLLDVFTTHYYPQGGSRLRNTRSLWDPNYTDESWINEKIYMIPRMKQWVNNFYPGTPIGITEYNFGALDQPDGGIAQADVLGIFGREGLDLATLWTTVSPNTPAYNAFKIYRNYDGNKSTFGDQSIKCTVPNPDNVSAFASLDSKTGEMKVIVLSKYASGDTPVTINLSNFSPSGNAKVYQWAGRGALSQKPDIQFTGKTVNFTAPAYSATLLVIKPSISNPTPSGTPLETATPTPTDYASATPTPTSSSLPKEYKFSGYIKPDFEFSQEVSGSVKSGFKVEIPGTSLSAVSDGNGYFEIKDVPAGSFSLKITKKNYLVRNEKNINIQNDTMVGTIAKPMDMWAGDLEVKGVQNNAINMEDIVELINAFNTSIGDAKYNPDLDWNKDTAINMTEILIIINHFNQIPENYPPATIETVAGTSTPKPTVPPPTAKTGKIKVQYYNAPQTIGDAIQVNAEFRVVNTGTANINLSDVKFRYYYTIDGDNGQSFDCWAQTGNSNITSKFVKMPVPYQGADYYLEIGFINGSLAPGESTIVNTWFNKNDWSIYRQDDDYSYNSLNSGDYYDWERAPGYVGGNLEWGIEPS